MKSLNLHLFATRNDLVAGLRSIDKLLHLRYALSGAFESSDVPVYSTLLECDNLGTANADNKALCDNFLVVFAETDIVVREVPQQNGGLKFFVDQRVNPVSICFQPGGTFGDDCIICGRIASISRHRDAVVLFKDFCKLVCKGFTKHQEYFVGPEAYSQCKAGKRLITNHIDEGVEYDLRLSGD